MIKKKLLVLLSITCLGFATVACSASSQSNTSQTPAANETAQTGGRADKVPDPDAPVLTIVSIYPINEDKTGLYQEMEAIDSKDAQLLVDKMIEYSILKEGTTVLSFKQEGSSATLDLNELDTKDKFILTSLINTFTENFELDNLNITINGQADSNLSNLKYIQDYKDIQ